MIYDNILDKMADVEESTNTYCRYVMDSVIPLSTDILREYSGNGDIGENNVETILHMINIWCDDRISNYVEFKDCLSSYLPIWKSIHVIKSNEIVIAKYNREKKMYYVNLLNVITVAIKYGSERLVDDLRHFINGNLKCKIMLFYVYPLTNTVVFGTVKRDKLLVILTLLTRYCNDMGVEDMDRDKHVLKRILCRYHRRLSPKSFICMVECLSQELREVLKCTIDEYSLKWMEERNKIMIKEELEGTRNKIGDVSTRLRHMTTELNELKIFFHKLHLESN